MCYRPSVRLSVCLSGCPYVMREDQSKALELRIMQLLPQNSPITLVSSWLTSPRNFKGNIKAGALNETGVGKSQFYFQPISRHIFRKGTRCDQGYYDGLIGSCMRFPLVPKYQNHRPWMTLNGRYALYCCKDAYNALFEPTANI